MEYAYKECRFDVVILDAKKENIIFVVEIKHWDWWNGYYDINRWTTKQFRKYLQYCPMYLVHKLELIKPTIEDIKLKLAEMEKSK